MTHPMLALIPDGLLERRQGRGADTRRAAELETWCVDHHFRPSFLELEQERRRRRLARHKEPQP
jgi:hypothetical protein